MSRQDYESPNYDEEKGGNLRFLDYFSPTVFVRNFCLLMCWNLLRKTKTGLGLISKDILKMIVAKHNVLCYKRCVEWMNEDLGGFGNHVFILNWNSYDLGSRFSPTPHDGKWKVTHSPLETERWLCEEEKSDDSDEILLATHTGFAIMSWPKETD